MLMIRSLLAVLVMIAAAPPAPPPPPAQGRVIERIATAKDPGQIYALYVPTGYRPERPAPVLYAFDVRGGARELAERLRPAAERFGWIVASPYSASSEIPMEDNFKIMSALWADTHARLAIDDRRVYAFGFSGLARFVCMLGLTAPEGLAGVIGASGGFPLGHPPARDTPFPFFATVGDRDFNYYEALDLDGKMAALGLPHRVEVFAGAHEWPPEPLAAAALGWMELQAMRRGTREKSPALLDALWGEDLARARAFEADGRLVDAARAHAALAADFAGLRAPGDLEDVARDRAALEASEAFQRQRKARQERDARDRAYLEEVPRILAAVPAEPRPDSLGAVIAELRIPELTRRAKAASDPEEKLAAERLLHAVSIQAGFHLPREVLERRQYDRAIFYLQVAGAIDPETPLIPFRLAAVWAQKGSRQKALEALALAVEKGWTDLVALETERAFDPLRQGDEYRKIVAEMLRRQRPAAR
jgi:phospholipase/carboxylesterase